MAISDAWKPLSLMHFSVISVSVLDVWQPPTRQISQLIQIENYKCTFKSIIYCIQWNKYGDNNNVLRLKVAGFIKYRWYCCVELIRLWLPFHTICDNWGDFVLHKLENVVTTTKSKQIEILIKLIDVIIFRYFLLYNFKIPMKIYNWLNWLNLMKFQPYCLWKVYHR